MAIDPTTGIDFGDMKYSVENAKGYSNGKQKVDGYKVTLENGMSLFIAKDNIQNGAKIEQQKAEGKFKNNVKFSGFNNISIWGSKDKDKIKVIDSERVHVIVDNDEESDWVSFGKNQQHNSVKGKESPRGVDMVQVRNAQWQPVSNQYDQDYDCHYIDKDSDGEWQMMYKKDSQHDIFGNKKRPELGL